jgi:hypothetical protein
MEKKDQDEDDPMTFKRIFEEMSMMKDEDLEEPTEDNEVAALRWYEQFAVQAYREITETNERDLRAKKMILANSIPEYYTPLRREGTMWSFVYEAESDRIPYWDRLPLVIRMIDNKDDPKTFMGINLHYLYPRYRKILLLSLMTKLNGDVSNENARILGMNMRRLFSFPNKYGKACIRRYKYDNIRRKPIRIPPEHWLKAIYLPTYHFVGARPTQVWGKTYALMKKMGLTQR